MNDVFDVIVLGGGVVGASIAYHLAELGGASVALLERSEVCSGGTGRSCAIVRSHYSVPSNTALALSSLEYFRDFAEALGEDDAECGFVNCGYLILAGPGSFADRLAANLALQSGVGAETTSISAAEARQLHPHLRLDDVAAIGYEPRSGYADPVGTTLGFLAAARRRGVEIRPHTPARRLRFAGDGRPPRRVVGVDTERGPIHAADVVSALGPWTADLLGSPGTGGFDLHLEVSRHVVLTLRGERPYGGELPIVKDLTVENKMYFRPADGGLVLVGTGDHGDPVSHPEGLDERAPPDLVALQRAQVGHRMDGFGRTRVAGAWAGPYDITPDWNPVLGRAPGIEGLHLAYGFSGHGFKLAPAVGRCLAQTVLGRRPDVDLAPYRHGRFADEALLVGAYGVGSIS